MKDDWVYSVVVLHVELLGYINLVLKQYCKHSILRQYCNNIISILCCLPIAEVSFEYIVANIE